MVASHIQTSPQAEPANKDAALVQEFIDGFLNGHPVLLSTQNLRTEPLFDSVQLIAHKEGLIATAYLYEAPIRAQIRQTSPYWEILHQSLVAQQFYPLVYLESSNQYIYRYCATPEGYALHCSSAKELWRACWGRGFSIRSGIPLDLLVWGQIKSQTKAQWHSLRGMDCHQGQLQAKVLGGSLNFAGDTWVIWAKQKDVMRSQQPRTRPDLRGYYRLRS